MNLLRALLLRRAKTPSPATCLSRASWHTGRVEEAQPRLQLSHELVAQLDAHNQALPRLQIQER
jgi:hypothetical protein